MGENVPIAANDLPGLLRFAREARIDLSVIGPDDPLAAGVVDLFLSAGLRVFGPTKSAARLESSKIFAKELMRKFHIPTALAGSFESSEEAHYFCERLQLPIVIKADGLALGKGVVIAQTCEEATATIDAMMNDWPVWRGGPPYCGRGISSRHRVFAACAGRWRGVSHARDRSRP